MRTRALTMILLVLILSVMSCSSQIVQNAERKPAADQPGRIQAIREMNTSRAVHTATLLNDGRVLVTGGFSTGQRSLASAEIYDPGKNEFSSAGNMSVTRSAHSATLLPNGNVLIAGGYSGEYLSSAEIYDVKTGRFIPAARMTIPRSGHIAVPLNDGKVLLAGGVGTGWTFLADAEVYDPATNTFTATGKMNFARESHTATLLRDGRVLITGGHRGRRSAITIYSSTEIYDPAKGTFSNAGDMNDRRHKHEAVILNDGRVLVVGGSDERDGEGAYSTAEIYDPQTGAFTRTGDMNLARYKLQGTAVVLNDGRILITGGASEAEIFDPATETFEIAAGNFASARYFATATLLQNGQVLILGGYDNEINASSQAWVYKTRSQRVTMRSEK